MPTCRKCKSKFPNKIIIGGRFRNLQRRKFCLICSPFGKHNTKPDDPLRKPIYGQKDGKKLSYTCWDKNAKSKNIANSQNRRREIKKKLVDIKGGECQKCGYKKCFRSLSFHHREPEKKLFNLDARHLAGTPWKNILIEVEKCDLLCLNCHMEVEEKKIQDKKSTLTEYKSS